MTKSRDIVAGGWKLGEVKLLSIREAEPFKTYLSLMKNHLALIAIKSGQREATNLEKETIHESAQNFNFEFNPSVQHKIWCKINLFSVYPDRENRFLKVEKKTYKALERITPSESWQQDWLVTWLVIDDESSLTTDPLLRSIVAIFGVKYSNLIQINEQRMLTIVNPEQVVLPETTLIKAIVNAESEQKRIDLKAEVRKIEGESVSRTPERKDCVLYLKNDRYQLPIDRKVLNISAYVSRT